MTYGIVDCGVVAVYDGGAAVGRSAGFDVHTTKVAKGKTMSVFLPVFQKTDKFTAIFCHEAKYGKYLT